MIINIWVSHFQLIIEDIYILISLYFT